MPSHSHTHPQAGHCRPADWRNRGGRWFVALLALALTALPAAAASAPVPLPRAHAHNDYEHPRPLLDALDHGFCSVEADIWLIGGQLLVAHNRGDTRPERTLQALYLDPLRERVRLHGGRVHPDGPPFTLMIDVKSEAESAYAALREVLRDYAGMLTRFTPTNTLTNAVTIILSGNRAAQTIAAEPARWVALDGRLSDLDRPVSPHLMPLISDNWNLHFPWRGTGSLPEAEREKLRQLVQRAHAQGRRIRFWATPDRPAVWRELRDAGVDLLNTDDLAGLRAFLQP